MAEIKKTLFRPKWMQSLDDEDREILYGAPMTGSMADVPPRIVTRIIPLNGSSSISARTLSESVGIAQTIINYAGRDLCDGVNPEFADLRSLGADVLRLTALSIDSFDEGSFVIPARLEAEPATVDDLESLRTVTTEDVANRFNAILESFWDEHHAASVSIGAIQAIESIVRILRREAEAIEFSSYGTRGQSISSVRVDSKYLRQVTQIREARRPTYAQLEYLDGTITAVDIRSGKLQLSIEAQRDRVAGNFPPTLLQPLTASLAQKVRLHGIVTWKGKKSIAIQVFEVESLDDGSNAVNNPL